MSKLISKTYKVSLKLYRKRHLGLIDTPEKATDVEHQFRQADVDMIFLYVTTYALSSTVLPHWFITTKERELLKMKTR
jgi:L-arabinose isomerase